MTRLLITGSKGLLGTELKKYIDPALFEVSELDLPEYDITDVESIKAAFRKFKPEVVLHLAAYTGVDKAEYEKRKCFTINVKGTANIARRAPFLIYMSTEYIFDGERGNYHEGSTPNPVNFYSLTKLLGEYRASEARRYCIVRTLFKPRPFKHEYVCTDMWTSGDYVDVIAKKISIALSNWQRLPRVLHIGTGYKNLYEMALQTNKNAKPIKRSQLPIRLPRDTSLNCDLWNMSKFEEQSEKPDSIIL